MVDLLRASTLLAFSVLYAVVVAKSEQWFGGHHYAAASERMQKWLWVKIKPPEDCRF